MFSTLIEDERDRLDHQRCRIEAILAEGIVSDEMGRHLRGRLAFIHRRLRELTGFGPPNLNYPGLGHPGDLPPPAGYPDARHYSHPS